MKKPMEPVRCACGKKPTVSVSIGFAAVICRGRDPNVGCWVGPERSRQVEAIRAWNRVMERKP